MRRQRDRNRLYPAGQAATERGCRAFQWFVSAGVSGSCLFENIRQVREIAWFWRLDYNEEHPHKSLGNLPPAIYRAKLENPDEYLEEYMKNQQVTEKGRYKMQKCE